MTSKALSSIQATNPAFARFWDRVGDAGRCPGSAWRSVPATTRKSIRFVTVPDVCAICRKMGLRAIG
jgi:hypothetical protein